ncbi:MAG: 2-phospho-L-lactate transferase CofD family protein [Candidatus Omnitrophica bacterium]|nr:2-phospho-L-lactate transferase CofD family protein [Candidatus Omnitrophota bacterium]
MIIRPLISTRFISAALAITFIATQVFASDIPSNFSNDKLSPPLASDPDIIPGEVNPVRTAVAREANPGAIGDGAPLLELLRGNPPPRIILPEDENKIIIQKLLKAIDLAIKLRVDNKNNVVAEHQDRVEKTTANLIALQNNLSKYAYLFNADINSRKDYLLGFNSGNDRGYAIELINRLSPEHLAQYIFHICIPEEGMVTEKDGHEAVYKRIKSAIFGPKEVSAFEENWREVIDEKFPLQEKESLKVQDSPPARWGSDSIRAGPEYKAMLGAMRQLISSGAVGPGLNNAYSYIRNIAKVELKEKFNADVADEAIREIKEWIAKAPLEPADRKTVRQLMLNQSKEYFNLVNGFGPIAYNTANDKMENLKPREEMHEEAFFASMQAADTLEKMGETSAITELLMLAEIGLAAHREEAGLEVMQKRLDNAKKQQNKDVERKYDIVFSSNFEAVRRWMAMENMISKCISNLGLRAESASTEYKQANDFLIAVMLNYQAAGEAYYWVRQQAAYRLRDYSTEETIAALSVAMDKNRPEGRAPQPSTIFLAANLEAANPNALTIGLAAGQSMLHIQRVKAEKEIIDNPETFNFEQRQYRFVRLVAALDALGSEEISNDIRIKIMNRISGIEDDETAFAANFLLDAMEEMVKGQRNKYARIFQNNKVSKDLKDPLIRQAALKVISRIARAVLPRLKAKNALLAKELSGDILFLDGISQGRYEYDLGRFRKVGRKLHVTLGNLDRLDKLESFSQGEEYLNFNRDIVIGSGGGASASMSGVTDPALAIIGATDNGGATLLVRSFETIQNGIFVGGFGDHLRFMYEAAVLDGAPGALMIRDVLNHRFGSPTRTLVEEIKAQHSDKLKKARQSGPEEAERFEEIYKKLLEIAAKIDAEGMSGDFNSVKNMILEGLMYQAEGIGDGLMNPDGIYASFEAFRRLVGAKSLAIPDIPIGNEIIIKSVDGEEYIGQSYYSHVPRGFNRGRQSPTLRPADIDYYYPEVAVRSRVMGAISRAKLLLFGLGSWQTSIGILLKNPSLVSAVADNVNADKILVTNPVRDGETRGMSWRESTVSFPENLMKRPLGSVFNRVLANVNRNLDRLVLAARPQLGTVRQVYNNPSGGYAGENTPTPEDVAYMKRNNIKMVTSEMASVKLSPTRADPNSYIAAVHYEPERFAEGLWSLISDKAKDFLGSGREVDLIRRGAEIERLLHEKGFTLSDIGLGQIHEVIFNPTLAKELSEWLNSGRTPAWAMDKRPEETTFQFMIRKAVERSAGHLPTDVKIKLDEEITVSNIHGKDVRVEFLSPHATESIFPPSRIFMAETGDIEALRNEELHRLGVIRGPIYQNDNILIFLPYDLLAAGDSLKDRIKRIEVALSFQLEKAKNLLENGFTDESSAHEKAIEPLRLASTGERKDYSAILAELSAAIPYLRFLRSSLAVGSIPNTMFDMDGTFAASGTPHTPEMAYYAWKFFKSPRSFKTIITARQFEWPLKYVLEEVERVTRRLRWIETRSGVSLEDGTAGNDFLSQVPTTVSSGRAVLCYGNNPDNPGYAKVYQEPMDDFTVLFIELAARLTMPDAGYPVNGYQAEVEEPYPQPDGSTLFTAISIFSSGRDDKQRTWDPRPACVKRTLHGKRVRELLLDPAKIMAQVERLLASEGGNEKWQLLVRNGSGEERVVVLPEQHEFIRDLYGRIGGLLSEKPKLRERLNKPIDILYQPSGETTIIFSPMGKEPHDVSEKEVSGPLQAPDPLSMGKGAQIPTVEQVIRDHSGRAKETMPIAFFGDEMSSAMIPVAKDRGEENLKKIPGNDYSVAYKAIKGDISPYLLTHVGKTGGGIETLPNTTTLYGKSALMPHDVVYLMAYSAVNTQRGESCKLIEENAQIRREIEAALRGRPLSEFGIASFQTMNERQARELLLWLERTKGSKLSVSGVITPQSTEAVASHNLKTQISEDLPARAEKLKFNLIKILTSHPDQIFFMGIETSPDDHQETQTMMPLCLAVDEIQNLKDSKGNPLFPNLIMKREGATKLAEMVKNLNKNGDEEGRKLNLSNAFIGAREDSVDNTTVYDAIKGEGKAWISAINDSVPGDYLPVFEAITLNMMAYLNADTDAIKHFYDTIADKPIDPDELKKMIRDRIIYIVPKAAKFDAEQLRELYELAREAYAAA